jgi:hypothetical protein
MLRCSRRWATTAGADFAARGGRPAAAAASSSSRGDTAAATDGASTAAGGATAQRSAPKFSGPLHRVAPHALLGVDQKDVPGMSDKELKAAYHAAALSSHPDVAGGSHELFQAIQAAYATLKVDRHATAVAPAAGGRGAAAAGARQYANEAALRYGAEPRTGGRGFYDHPHARPAQRASRTFYDEDGHLRTEGTADPSFVKFAEEYLAAVLKGDRGFLRRKREEKRQAQEEKEAYDRKWSGYTAEEEATAVRKGRVVQACRVVLWMACAATGYSMYTSLRRGQAEWAHRREHGYTPEYLAQLSKQRSEVSHAPVFGTPYSTAASAARPPSDASAKAPASSAFSPHAVKGEQEEMPLGSITPAFRDYAIDRNRGVMEAHSEQGGGGGGGGGGSGATPLTLGYAKTTPDVIGVAYRGRPFTPEGLARGRDADRRRRLGLSEDVAAEPFFYDDPMKDYAEDDESVDAA